eukprot:1130058-Amphidinium_carterae.1
MAPSMLLSRFSFAAAQAPQHHISVLPSPFPLGNKQVNSIAPKAVQAQGNKQARKMKEFSIKAVTSQFPFFL